MKLISDFDGIWTEQGDEAGFVWNYIIDAVTVLSGYQRKSTELFLQQCKLEMNKNPEKHGWFIGDDAACFYTEDPYGDNNAVFNYISKVNTDKLSADFAEQLIVIRESIIKKYKSLSDFSQECFTLATGYYKSLGRLEPVSNAEAIVREINSLGIDIVVVSNSTTDKIKYLFSRASVEVSSDPLAQRKKVHARGDAKKYMVYNSDSTLEKGYKINHKIEVPLRRSNYHQILIEEKPDFVIGDVFSLDIALPLHLRMNDKKFSKLKVIQRVQTYTPDWVKDHLSKAEFKDIAFMVNNVTELPEVLSRFKKS
ncbi:MAG: hypothetical protein SGI89_00650 [bacterium]|nr:hypothetical protein [bacterium]